MLECSRYRDWLVRSNLPDQTKVGTAFERDDWRASTQIGIQTVTVLATLGETCRVKARLTD